MCFEKGIVLMFIGYARVSSQEQNLDLQIDALKKAGSERIFTDKVSGISKEKPGLKEALSFLRDGDSLAVWKLDRLGRNLKGLIQLIEDLEKQGVNFQSITDGINTSTPAGKFFFHVMGSLSQMERELLIERTKAGLEAARKRGRTGGRKRKMTDSKLETAKKLLKEEVSPKEVAEILGVSIPTLYRWCPASEIS